MTRALAVDWGTKRVGLALSDPLRIGATPHSVVDREKAIEVIKALVAEQDVDTIVVGLPTGLSGAEGSSADNARNLGDELRRHTGVEVILRDERFTSRMAESALLESGMKRRERREAVDKVAAALILQDYLDSQK